MIDQHWKGGGSGGEIHEKYNHGHPENSMVKIMMAY